MSFYTNISYFTPNATPRATMTNITHAKLSKLSSSTALEAIATRINRQIEQDHKLSAGDLIVIRDTLRRIATDTSALLRVATDS